MVLCLQSKKEMKYKINLTVFAIVQSTFKMLGSNMQNWIDSNCHKLFYVFFILLFLLSSNLAFSSNPQDVRVTKITRIMHPAYRAGNIWYSIRNPWNLDYTRVLMYEAPYTHPDYKTIGRGLVWGFVEKLKNWKIGRASCRERV